MHILNELTAAEAVQRLKSGDVSPLELVEAAAGRIAEVEPDVNAIPTLCLERAEEAARRLMEDDRAPRDDARFLHGLPVVVKDLNAVAGVRTTLGSRLFADNVPRTSDPSIEAIEAMGAIVIGKSNTPELGAGANTFNDVFGETRNPFDTSMTCGGSSGGAAVALATGEAWLATGSDTGGSLRIPASFCSVVGVRPSPGRVPRAATGDPFQVIGVEGPMGRTVEDAAMLLDAQARFDPRDPLSLPPGPGGDTTVYADAARAARGPKRVAWSPDLGIAPVVPEVRDLCARAAARFADLGAMVEEACPDFSKTPAIFHTLRAMHFAARFGDRLDDIRDIVKPEIVWNIEKGLALTGSEVARALSSRAALLKDIGQFFETYDLLLCPTVMAPPFPVETRYLEEVAGHKFDNYVDWLMLTYAITVTACPALSLPCGFTEDRLPVGLQMVGRPRGEWALLGHAAAAEAIFDLATRVPIDPHVTHRAPARKRRA